MEQEFWDYYFNQKNRAISFTRYYGDETAPQKISALLEKIIQLYSKKNIKKPLLIDVYNPKDTILYFIGDIHGAFFDLNIIIHYFEAMFREAQQQGKRMKCVFLGDYVDRNEMDIHTLLYLISFNLRHPKDVILLRGNHEEQRVNTSYGFKKNVKSRFRTNLYLDFARLFELLPIAAFIDSDGFNILALHGGIPINLEYPKQAINLRKTDLQNKFADIQLIDPISQQILWNDPIENLSKNLLYGPNFERGGSFYVFGPKIFSNFIKTNRVDMVIRGHQVFEQGFRYYFKNRFLSIFSARDYVNTSIQARVARLTYDRKDPRDVNVELLKITHLREYVK
ncbi:hypothetical protein NEF87_001296 [Candidatus Lokiarchaeum ossiferum]|uniref:Serine/threonine specific protein phosphatases domain-containing protein n=1 Tax=Candidatus Lokiarchaeum ossiferum TaxID=2951803 RepID=A0ABY6HNC2_9ARCH|nr:hypothetical protein NEF87_001296 [Candidatus Lokiarchaeum sp. B-35]